MKKTIYPLTLCLLYILFFLDAKSQTIPSRYFGINAWCPDSVGVRKPNGKLNNNWSNVSQSHTQLVRFGGSLADSSKPSNLQYIKMVDSIRSNGMEPILQVPYYMNTWTAAQAAAIVTYINITNSRKVKYWIIGNEPNLYAGNYKRADTIAAYIRRFSIAMKKVDSTIKIIGPELSRIKPEDHSDPDQKKVDSLTTPSSTNSITYSIVGIIPTGNGLASGKAYIDYFSWHMYNFDGSGANTQSRSWLISRLTSIDSMRMGKMKRKLDSCNVIQSRSNQPLKPVITEAQICTQGNSSNPPGDDVFIRVKSSSFFAGQHWCEALALGLNKNIAWINFWSAMEGNGMGYMTNSLTPVKKSTYYHMEQMAKWFNGTLYLGDDQDASGNSVTNIKAFGSLSGNHIAIMILNQDSVNQGNSIYTISLGNSFPSTSPVRIKMGMSTTSTYTDTIKPSSTTLLIYDCNGNISKKYRYEQNDSLNPFKVAWAATTPSTLLSVSISPSVAHRKSYCSATYTPTTTGCSGSVTYSWFVNDSFWQTGSTFTYEDVSDAVISVTASCSTGGACNPAKATAIYDHISGTPCDPDAPERLASLDRTTQELSMITALVPNPANDRTSIYYHISEEDRTGEIRILDLYGKVISRFNVSNGNETLEVDCSDYSAGIYFITLNTGGHISSSQKLLISK